jgi:heat shock protein HslJ
MKQRFDLLFLALTSLMLGSCSSGKISDNYNPLHRQWMLKQMPGFSYQQLLEASAAINLSDIKHPKGFAGCNNILFKVFTKYGRRIEFGNISSTKMYCADNMNLENSFLKMLTQIKFYKIEGHKITFKSKEDKVLAEAIAGDWD